MQGHTITFHHIFALLFWCHRCTAASAGHVKSSRHAAIRRPATARVVALPSTGHRVRVEFSRRCLCTLYALIGFEYEEMDDGADESWSRSLFHQTVISYLHSGLVVIEAHQGEPSRPQAHHQKVQKTTTNRVTESD